MRAYAVNVVIPCDGEAEIYMVMARFKHKSSQNTGWFQHVRVQHEPGFTPCDDCWQRYRINGCLDKKRALACYKKMVKHDEKDVPCHWALVRVKISQSSCFIETSSTVAHMAGHLAQHAKIARALLADLEGAK